MKAMKTVLLIMAMLAFTPIHAVYGDDSTCPDNALVVEDSGADAQPGEQHEDRKDGTGASLWEKAWGWAPKNALFLGMWSIHLDGTGEYFGNGSNNDQQDLLGIQLFGFAAGTFINSHDDPCWLFGPAREIYTHQLARDLRFDIGYKFGLLYGYGDDLPNINGMSVFANAVFSFTYKRLGFDIGVLPTFIVTGNFRIDIDF